MRRSAVEPESAAGQTGADARLREFGGLDSELFVNRAVGRVVLIGTQGAHNQIPLVGGETQARSRNTISQKRRIRWERARGQFILRNTGKKLKEYW